MKRLVVCALRAISIALLGVVCWIELAGAIAQYRDGVYWMIPPRLFLVLVAGAYLLYFRQGRFVEYGWLALTPTTAEAVWKCVALASVAAGAWWIERV